MYIISAKKLLTVIPLIFMVVMFNACVSRSDHNYILSKCDSLQIALKQEKEMHLELNKTIECLNDSISKLSYPADQRLYHIQNLIKSDSLDLATTEIENLRKIFPHSKESQLIYVQEEIIEKRKTAIRKEQERIKALGFKALKEKSSILVKESAGDVKYTFSNFHFGRQFTFNYINDIEEYYYRTADKGNTYILADMAIYTQADYAFTPSIYACVIVDGKLSQIGYFTSEYESYDTYGAYLGNYADTKHDFSKVNTVKYKIATQISQREASLPIVILMIKDDNLHSVNGLTVSEVSEKCEVIKILNRSKF